MKSYQPSTPRTVLAMAAVALSVFTVAMMVVLPSQVDWKRASPTPLASTSAPQAVPTEVATRFVRVDVVATRGRKVALTQGAPENL